jgi:uncharacterized coiled-coil protein SlyX
MSDETMQAIEIKLAYLEKSVNDLGGLVYDYGRRTERLEEAVRGMAKRLSELGSEKGPGMPAGERPPHY